MRFNPAFFLEKQCFLLTLAFSKNEILVVALHFRKVAPNWQIVAEG